MYFVQRGEGGQTPNLIFLGCHFGNNENFITPHLDTRSFPRASYDINRGQATTTSLPPTPSFVCFLTQTGDFSKRGDKSPKNKQTNYLTTPRFPLV